MTSGSVLDTSAKPRTQPAIPVLRITSAKLPISSIAFATTTPHPSTQHIMAFPGGPGSLPAAMNPNAGMSEQEQQMVKAVRPSGREDLGRKS